MERYLAGCRVDNCALWFLKLPHSEAKGQVISNVNILGGFSSALELLETIGNSVLSHYALAQSSDLIYIPYVCDIPCSRKHTAKCDNVDIFCHCVQTGIFLGYV